MNPLKNSKFESFIILPLALCMMVGNNPSHAFDSGCFQIAVEANDRATQDFAGQNVAARIVSIGSIL